MHAELIDSRCSTVTAAVTCSPRNSGDILVTPRSGGPELAMHPEVLMLDEPTANLDPAARREFADLIKRLGMTTLLVTHDLPYALELCPRALIIDHGQIVADGPTRELLADTGFMSAHRLELHTGFNPLGT